MNVVSTVAGALLILVVLREVFHTLFHPSGQGGLSMLVFRAIWGLTGRLGSEARGLAGPLSMVLVIVLWAGALIVGFALVYWPALPDGFIFASPLDAGAHDELPDAIYVSWVTQTTLGYGDITPIGSVLRMLAPLQAAVGFGLLTIAVTWVLSVYPALQRRRTAASAAHAMRDAQRRQEASAQDVDASALARRLERLSDMISTARADLVQYPATFYFAAPRDSLSLAAALPYVTALSREGDLAPEAAAAARELAATLDAFATEVGERMLGMEDAETADVLAAFRRHHGLPGAEDGG